MRRPDFISHSRERVKRLELVAEERKLQRVFQRERERLFSHPTHRSDWKPKAANSDVGRDIALLEKKRSIPWKEMVSRSKRAYDQLPEVQQRRKEEKRKAEYTSYRLKAELFKKRVTNHVLGRKTPWN
ncbi:Alstrom syndrome protein 1 homolog [Protopterus annectens]|uniref:Alstrom syndrome protein 1 homolog n=1 Tax=Protopterus annectens TaxID=7888 RepID=UPI001CFB7B9A|nr:Alstrom syndrome protein 1 homolog [Protopterus annectens]